jgi:hypothetical protein
MCWSFAEPAGQNAMLYLIFLSEPRLANIAKSENGAQKGTRIQTITNGRCDLVTRLANVQFFPNESAWARLAIEAMVNMARLAIARRQPSTRPFRINRRNIYRTENINHCG